MSKLVENAKNYSKLGFGQYSKLVENAKNYSICLFMNVK